MSFDTENYLKAVRLSGLAVGPGGKLAVGAGKPGRDGKAFETELRAVDPVSGETRRLVAPKPGVGPGTFTTAGDLLFIAKREDTEAPEEQKVGDAASLWLLPAGGGEARRLLSAPAGIGGVVAARDADVLLLGIDMFPAATSFDEDRELAKGRADTGVTAYLSDDYPIRFWDHPLGPRWPRLFVTDSTGTEPRDLTGHVGRAIGETVLSADGTTVYAGWTVPQGKGVDLTELVSIDIATGERATLVTEPGVDVTPVATSPDGRWLAYLRVPKSTKDTPIDQRLWLLEPATGERRELVPELDRWTPSAAFTADSQTLILTGDDLGSVGVWSVPVAEPGAAATMMTRDGAFTEVTPARDGTAIFAMRSRIGSPPEVVTFAPGEAVRVLHSEGFSEAYPGRVEEVTAIAADGTPLRAWLVVPEGLTGPAPLTVFIHGGPRGSWNAWQWRWQPMLLAARGYAVLLPDPAISTGYGQRMQVRGHGQWGGNPYTDVLALTDAALERDDLDASRTAVMGGSYGGYLTNWTITHTDRFKAAVTHAALWDLSSFRGGTDNATFWEDEMGHPRHDREFYEKWSPATYADAIVTPTLVIHGEKDFRVPVGEGLSLYTELQRAGVPSQLLYFPDENHWIMKPGNITIWYDAVLAWLDHRVLGKELVRPGHV